MRVVKTIAHPEMGISLFSWNEKYLIKFEMGNLEQTYKVKAMDVIDLGSLEEMVQDEQFIKKILDRFELMQEDFHQTLSEYL